MRRFLKIISLLCLAAGLSGCLAVYDRLTGVDIAAIKKRGKLLVITTYGPNSYFLYRGEPLGYEYELLALLAKDLGVSLEIVLTKDIDSAAYMPGSGPGDIVAADITVTRKRAQSVQFTEYLNLTRQVLVQRQAGYRPPENPQAFAELIRNPIDLIGKKVYVREGSSYYLRLKNLSEEIGGNIDIVSAGGEVLTEELMRKVSTGEIDYTVADENTALINRGYYPGLDVETPISFPQRIAWVVRNESPELLKAVNSWILKNRGEPVFNAIYSRYYLDPRQYAERRESEFSSLAGGKISPYDNQFRQISASLGWDWRLLASLACQESRFDPMARSWAGAVGLLQLMPATWVSYGVRNPLDPADNLKGGVSHLKYLFEYWKDIKDPEERLKFVLGSYNAGQAHVEDARKLALKAHRNPDVWTDNVELSMLDLAKPEFFNDPVVQYGYCRGEEPYLYVRHILDRYRHYKKFVS